MEGEMGAGARIAIALIVIGVIISVIFVILGFTRGTTNQGITTVQTSMDSMSLAQFDDYDQQILSGTQVMAAVKLFEGRPVGTIIITKKSVASKGYNYGAIFEDAVENATDGAMEIPISTLNTALGGNSYYTLDLDADKLTSPYTNYLPMKSSGTDSYVRPT